MSTIAPYRPPATRTRPVRKGAVPRRVRAGGSPQAPKRAALGWILMFALTRVWAPAVGLTAWLVASVPPDTVTLVRP